MGRGLINFDEYDFQLRPSYGLWTGILCVAAVWAVHKTKKDPTDATKLRESLWGFRFKPLTDLAKAVILVLGVIGLLALLVHTTLAMGSHAGIILFSVVTCVFRYYGLFKLLRAKVAQKLAFAPKDHKHRPGPPPPLPVWVLAGFLGGGKTTLANRLVRVGGSRMLVIENEVGDTRLDAELIVQASGKPENVLLVNNGCACCKVRGDLCDLLRDEVLGRRHARGEVDGVILECSGLADPAAVTNTFLLDEDLRQRLELREVIAVVDAVNAGKYLHQRKSSDPLVRLLQEQIAFASIVLLNKMDSAPGSVDRLLASIREINQTAEILQCSFCDVNVSQLLADPPPAPAHAELNSAWLRPSSAWSPDRALLEIDRINMTVSASSSKAAPPIVENSEVVRCVSIHLYGDLDLDTFNRWAMRMLQDDRPMRAKGVLAVEGYVQKLAFQAVHAVFHGTPSLAARWKPDEQRYSEIVVIGRNLRPDLLEYGLKRCLASENLPRQIPSRLRSFISTFSNQKLI